MTRIRGTKGAVDIYREGPCSLWLSTNLYLGVRKLYETGERTIRKQWAEQSAERTQGQKQLVLPPARVGTLLKVPGIG